MKHFYWLFISSLFFGSCIGSRMRSNEQFLSFSESQNSSVLIVSFLGETNSETVGLLIIPPAESQGNASSFVYSFNGKTSAIQSFFNDSTIAVTSGVFPSVIQNKASGKTGFHAYIYRNKLVFRGMNKAVTIFAFDFKRQRPFVTIEPTSGISGIIPIDAIAADTGKLFIHSLESPEQLFSLDSNEQYWWVDFILNDQPHTLYLKRNADGSSELIYSSLPITFPNHIYQEPLFLQVQTESGELIDFRLTNSDSYSKGKSGFSVASTTLFSNSNEIGNGIIYYLSQ